MIKLLFLKRELFDCHYLISVFTQHEYDKWTSYQKVRREAEKRKQAEAQERSKREMLKSLEGEDVSHIDIDSDEGTLFSY